MKAWKRCPTACPHLKNCKLAEEDATCDTCYFNAGDICTAACKVKREYRIACWFYWPRCGQTNSGAEGETE